MRHFVERTTRNWVYCRRLPQAAGGAPIFVTPSAGLKYLFKPMAQIDPPLLRNAIDLVRPGDVVWDIGANVGLFAFAAASCAGVRGSVVAFEPDAFLVNCLRRSASIQPASSAPVTVIAAAIASEISLRAFTIASRSRASNAFSGYGETLMGAAAENLTVVAVNLDWLDAKLPPPNVIKCDVEGAEAEVFVGQKEILANIRPVIICEVTSKSASQLTATFREYGYALYDGDKPLAAQGEIAETCWNTVAIPRNLVGRYLK
jgi:FkbM family methyltransferase